MIQMASYTDVGGRPQNEDAVRFASRTSNQVCAVLADGLGGHGGGARASAQAAETICTRWGGDSSPEALEALVQQAHRAVLQLQSPQCAMKSTVVVLALDENRAGWAHVGDSRLYHFSQGKLVFQTQDHSASQIAVMLGDITVEQIRFHEDRNRVLRALGQESTLRVTTGSQLLSPGRHAFLLCSDGFWEYVLETEMEQALAQARDPEDWLERMRSLLCKRVSPGNDNNTAAAIWVAI